MKRFFILHLLVLLALVGRAQTITVKSFEVVPNDLEARTNPKKDGNGEYCALLKVSIPALKDMHFTGWVSDVTYTPGEYKVYVPQGTKKVKFNHEKYAPGEIVFSEPAGDRVVYRAVLELPAAKKVHVTDANAKLEEARALFEQRKYADAKIAYEGAGRARDITSEQRLLVRKAKDLCDTCSYYTRVVNGAYKEMKAKENLDQAVAAEYADIAIQGMRHLCSLNPSPFYEKKITELETFVDTMPLSMRFTVTQWIKSAAGVEEGGGMANVELWAVYGDAIPSVGQYEIDKNFKKYMDQHPADFVKVGATGSDGIADIDFERERLPRCVIFRPVEGTHKNAVYDMTDVREHAKGMFKKRQVRIRIY